MIVDNLGVETDADSHGGAVAKAATGIRGLVLRRVLLPGEQVRQEDVARRIGMSRGPIREALQVLAAEGVLKYVRNRGYFVTRFTAEEMRQLYLIRDLLESQIMLSLPPADAGHLESLRRINNQIRTGHEDLTTVIRLNRQFHDLVFEPSPLNLLKSEIDQINRMSMAYQSLSLNPLTDWELVADDHQEMIDALAAGDNERLAEHARVHRNRSLTRLSPLLG
jgi:DNA-binding GntR family transcriptional regulator